MNSTSRQHVVLCEGFDDRSFWKGWLLRGFGCGDPTDGGKTTVRDVFGQPVKGKGRFLFRTRTGSDVIVQPFGGRENAKRALEELFAHQAYRRERVIVNLDCDAQDPKDPGADDQIRGIVRSLGGTADGEPPYRVGSSAVYPVIWRCDDPVSTPGLPAQQTLERLATAAIRAAYPERGPAVGDWLAAAPAGLSLPRSFGHSYFAKWYSDHGAGDFYECLWRESAVAAELERRLRASDAWGTVEELVDD